jgi:hypothetical protein
MTGEKSDDGVGEGQREDEAEMESVDVIDGDEKATVSDIVVSKGIEGEKLKSWNARTELNPH